MNGTGAIWPAIFFLLALLISILASHIMFNFIGNLKRTSGIFRQFWLAGGTFVFGVGLWAKHFVTVIALNQPFLFTWTMAIGLLLIIFFSLMSFIMMTFHGVLKYRLLFGSLILAFGIALMSVFSILGQPIQELIIHPAYFTLSLAVLVTGTYISFFLSENYTGKRGLASVTLGVSVVMVQLLGVKAVEIDYFPYYMADRLNQDINQLAIIVGVGALLILVATMVIWYIDKRLNQMDERYRLLVENSLDTIAILKGSHWGYMNAAGLSMFEAEHPHELLGKSIYTFLPCADHNRVQERLKNLVFTGASKPLEQAWVTLKGKVLHTEVVETITTVDNEPAVQVIIRDISERKKNEELMINSEKLYVAGQLAAGIAHEIRNPLTSLKGFLQLMAKGKQKDNNTAAYFDIMHSELDRIEGIVSELLMLSKPQVYELNYQDVRVMMRDTVTLLETQAILHNIAIEAEYGTDPLWIYGVENQVKQVFINVIKNAIEAMIDGGAIHIKLFREQDAVYMRIHDEGPGIGEDQLAKMGQPFYTTKEKGTGLGLMVSYKIIDNHQGKIVVNSTLGNGTLFEIMLPFRYPESDVKMTS
jgi:two-component system, sporulation sensor kinase A